MAFKIIRQEYPPYEEYADTFSDWEKDMDRNSWRGTGSTMEFPHNPGALEEKIDEAEGRKITRGGRKGY